MGGSESGGQAGSRRVRGIEGVGRVHGDRGLGEKMESMGGISGAWRVCVKVEGAGRVYGGDKGGTQGLWVDWDTGRLCRADWGTGRGWRRE